MVFSSLFFICVFLPICLGMYYIIKSRTYRNWVLIATSLLFYAWGEPVWVLLLIFSTFFNWFMGLLIDKNIGNWRSKVSLGIAVAENLLFLVFFKYSGFIADNINGVLGTSIQISSFALPIGISFYTFQIISYVVDVYRRDVAAQKSPFKLLLYVSMFHQLIAGPILRYKDIAEAIDHRVESAKEFNYGVGRFIMGLGKKVLIANTAGKAAEAFLGTDYSRLPVTGAWLGIIFFSIQIYFDFSGYSDMAIGLGRMFGFRYKENFNYPYISRSVTEFWRRWHISLSSFFRDYVYIPLGGNRSHKVRNLFLVWLLTGLWHGASWNFIIWGLYYFLLLLAEKLFLSKLFEKIPTVFARVYLWVAVIIGWVFFYHTDLSQALNFLGIMFGVNAVSASGPEVSIYFWNNALFLIIAFISCTPAMKWIYQGIKVRSETRGTSGKSLGVIDSFLRPAFNICVLVLSIIFLVGQSYNPFLYFRF